MCSNISAIASVNGAHADDDQLLSVEALYRTLSFEKGRFQAELDTVQLRSSFQPIVSLSHERIVGQEALLRPFMNQLPYPAEKLFVDTHSLHELIRRDRTARLLHTINFSLTASRGGWLFLNVHPQVFIHGHHYAPFFKQMLDLAGLPPQRIVIEVLESACEDESRFAEGVLYYRELGCLIALDDFGARHSNIDRLLRLHPDIVKFDHSLLQRAANNTAAQRMLARLVALLHEAGIMVVIEGIENVDQALIALDADADFGQGYLFGRPVSEPLDNSIAFDFELLNHRLQQCREQQRKQDEELQQLIALFRDTAFRCEGEESLAGAALGLLANDKVLRVYLLDASGREVERIISGSALAAIKPQLTPLLDTRGANWSRRPYFRSAIASPRNVQLTDPYRSITIQEICRTLSITIQGVEGMQVLCCDIAWQE